MCPGALGTTLSCVLWVLSTGIWQWRKAAIALEISLNLCVKAGEK